MVIHSKDQIPALPGATIADGGVHFRVWAPERNSVSLVLVDSDGRELRTTKLDRAGGGFLHTFMNAVGPNALYFYRLDDDSYKYPDPASHFQPHGVFGPSQVVDHSKFQWTDDNWRGVKLAGQVMYELHVGTFTPEGTWRAAMEKLPKLRDIGVTTLEVMPVAAFPGEFGWGYDGVFWYAPTQLYGTPDDFRTFVDRAHELELGVILDVVYNHFGPAGNFTGQFSAHYLSKKHHTEWGDAINFDSDDCGPVREFVAENAAYWVREFHIDGLRLDATQAIVDDSEEHIIAKLTRAARTAASGKSIVVFSEDEKNRCFQVRPHAAGGWGTNGLFNDDFHHACRVAATGSSEGYYRDYTGSPQELISLIRYGHLYQGQWNPRQGRIRGFPTEDIAAPHLIHYLQNHDQVANSARGYRTHLLTSPSRHRALTALLLLGPETPMLFMGEEFGASNPFLYFADHEEDLAQLVNSGRREFMHQFPRIKSLEDVPVLRDPSDKETFAQCKMNWDEWETNSPMVELHRDLIQLRREDAVIARQDRFAIQGSVIGPEAFALRWFGGDGDDRLALFNLGRDVDCHPIADPMLAAPFGRQWEM
ncbi:MAG TPA: malto-oligosyltrehalose trehalohydrolase, partial [Lacipirellulaceae bacterium]|nr:malto-oligosyltrehalose trehalohydrolase [Lacipirellulaceae bacterium]